MSLFLVLLLWVFSTADWQTTAERTDFRQTSTYNETLDYCKRLAASSSRVRLTSFGTSPEGREMPLLILSREGVSTPEEAHRTGRPIVLIQNGIHAGEIDGKEASLMLAREIVITRSLERLLDHAVVLIIPIYNVDGHEASSPYNRINQNGPEQMGARTTARNLNLNRDYMKADAAETRAFLRLFNAWQPHLFIDTHVTDGADFQYDVLFTVESQGYVAPEVGRYISEVFYPRVKAGVEKAGHITEQYFNLRDPKDPSQGMVITPFTPRFSNGFGALRHRPTMLVETHMLKDFKTRVKATYDLLVETLLEVNRDPNALKRAVEAAERATIETGRSFDEKRRTPLRFTLKEQARKTIYRGNAYKLELSEVSGDMRVVYSKTPQDMEVIVWDEVKPEVEVAQPLAYAIPPAWTEVIERLEAHGLRLERLKEPITAEFESYVFTEPKWYQTPYEGRQPLRFKSSRVTERRTLPAGTVIVRLDQPAAKIAIHLLEPDSPDSLVAWGFFNTIFEQKEYAEDYLLEKLAREMMQRDPKLKAEFEAKVRQDEQFRRDPEARLNFFYTRSPYYEPMRGHYPVVRLTKQF